MKVPLHIICYDCIMWAPDKNTVFLGGNEDLRSQEPPCRPQVSTEAGFGADAPDTMPRQMHRLHLNMIEHFP